MKLEMYEEMHHIENTHWWFRAKRTIVGSLLDIFMDGRQDMELVDFGCGCGAMLMYLANFGHVTGIDCSDVALTFCREKHFSGPLIKMNLETDEPDESLTDAFDIGVALDVLEHIDDDRAAAKNIFKMLRPDGRCIITVPAYQWMWSYHDENCMHKRRYNIDGLRVILANAGFEVEFLSYYNTYLFPPAAVLRMLAKAFHVNKDSDLENSNKDSLVNKALYRVFSSEKKRIVEYKRFPFGLSLIAVVHKL